MFKNIIQSIYFFLHPPLFSIKVIDSKAVVKGRKFTQVFLNDCIDIFNASGVKSGFVYGIETQYGIRLKFSNQVPPMAQQRIRNIWNFNK